MSAPVRVGVLGVGSMGCNHARVYSDLDETELVGVADVDAERAREIASRYDTEAFERADLLERVDAVSVAVPTDYHYELARDAIESGTHVLVEKPFVRDTAAGRDLVERANERDVEIQVGHVERFNPALDAARDYLADETIIAVSANRLSPPVEREIPDSAVFDLMIHDLDILLSLVDADVSDVASMSVPDGRHTTAELRFDDGTVGQLAASHVTQRTVRELTVTAEDSLVHVDYVEQAVEVYEHRPDGAEERDVVEHLAVEDAEPLARELRSFAETARDGGDPTVTAEDGLRVVSLASDIERDTFLAADAEEA